jgi:hypothetical protein
MLRALRLQLKHRCVSNADLMCSPLAVGCPCLSPALDRYTQKLAASRKKVTAVNSLLTDVQSRVNKLNATAMKATKRKQAELGITAE